jgi:hypothetical protein
MRFEVWTCKRAEGGCGHTQLEEEGSELTSMCACIACHKVGTLRAVCTGNIQALDEHGVEVLNA